MLGGSVIGGKVYCREGWNGPADLRLLDEDLYWYICTRVGDTYSSNRQSLLEV